MRSAVTRYSIPDAAGKRPGRLRRALRCVVWVLGALIALAGPWTQASAGPEETFDDPGDRSLSLISPVGGEFWSGCQTVQWSFSGASWNSSDSVSLWYSMDDGATWEPAPNALYLSFELGGFLWDTTAVPGSGRARLRVVCDGAPGARAETAGRLMINNTGLNYYVNDPSTSRDVFCTAPGHNANDGLSPDQPKADIQAVIDSYPLIPGDAIWVDAGIDTTPGNLPGIGSGVRIVKPPTERVLTLLSPGDGECWRGVRTVQWKATGLDWTGADTVSFFYSADDGLTWSAVLALQRRPWSLESELWDTTAVPDSRRARLRVVCDAAPGARAETAGWFMINNTGFNYFVNDAATNGDVYCTAPGSNDNDGFSPGAPKASIQAVIEAYTLQPGDVIRVDAGTYRAGLSLGPGGSGVRIVGPPGTNIAVLDASAIPAAIELNGAADVSVQGLYVRNRSAGWGVYAARCERCQLDGLTVFSCGASGVRVSGSSDGALRHCLVYANGPAGSGSPGVSLAGARGWAVENNTVYGNAGDEIVIEADCSDISIRNNILWETGPGHALRIEGAPLRVRSDYNDLYATGSGSAGFKDQTEYSTLDAWRAATGCDLSSLSADPEFVNWKGFDDILGGDNFWDDDFHLQSTAASLHRIGWLPDMHDSPCLDAGDPAGGFSDEPPPNGGRINLGAYGGTRAASLSAGATNGWLLLTDTNWVGVLQDQTPGRFHASLNRPPMTGVVVSVSWEQGDTNIQVLSGATLAFTPANWAIPQAVVLGAGPDWKGSVDQTAVFVCQAPGWTCRRVQAGVPEPQVPAPLANVNPVAGTEGGLAHWPDWTPGTDPPQAGCVLSVTRLPGDPGGFQLAFPSAAGESCQLWRSAGLAPAQWVPASYSTSPGGPWQTNTITGTGSTVTLFLDASSAAGFYRLSIAW